MTTRVGIIGWPLKFTLSPAMHNAAFRALDMDWHYDAMAIPPDIVRLGLREPAQHGYVGLNVTIPHKETVMPFVRADATAKAIGAVNTVDLRTAAATNTDVIGFIEDLKAHGVELRSQRVIVLGAGGAARAAIWGLAGEGADVMVVNRTLERAQTMLANLSLHNPGLSTQAMTLDDAVERGASLVVNCTPVGMWPDVEDTPWINGLPFPRGAVAYDMVYRPAVTRFMQMAEAQGGQAICGLGMLVRQGAASFQQWTQREGPVEVMFEAARAALAQVS
jgi:shikimate dehydrogenase